MKCIVKKEFYSPRIGNAIKGNVIEIPDNLAEMWIEHGLLLPYNEDEMEIKPLSEPASKETKPAPKAKKQRKARVKKDDDSV